MALLHSIEIGPEVLKILGLSDQKVTSIHLKIDKDDFVRLEVTRLEFPTEEQIKEVFHFLSQYSLHKSEKNENKENIP